MTKFIIWIREARTSEWELQGGGPLPEKTANRIAREIRPLCWKVRVLPVGEEP